MKYATIRGHYYLLITICGAAAEPRHRKKESNIEYPQLKTVLRYTVLISAMQGNIRTYSRAAI